VIDLTRTERRWLIRKAGRPDLIDPATCERFGITEDWGLPPGVSPAA
jgi:hypothetical protein